jgi:hypothetical protein
LPIFFLQGDYVSDNWDRKCQIKIEIYENSKKLYLEHANSGDKTASSFFN